MNKILKVVKIGSVQEFTSTKTGMNECKRSLVVQDPVGRFPDQFVVTLFGDDASRNYSLGQCLITNLRFRISEINDRVFQDVTADGVLPLV